MKIIRNKIEKIYENRYCSYLVIKCSEIQATEDNYVALQELYSETAEGFCLTHLQAEVVDDSCGNIVPGTTGCGEGWQDGPHAWVEAGSCFNMTSHASALIVAVLNSILLLECVFHLGNSKQDQQRDLWFWHVLDTCGMNKRVLRIQAIKSIHLLYFSSFYCF